MLQSICQVLRIFGMRLVHGSDEGSRNEHNQPTKVAAKLCIAHDVVDAVRTVTI
jgi:hypothetical protein